MRAVAQRYERGSLLGAGGTAEVWLARGADGLEVALKCAVRGHEREAALELEARILERIVHPNVVGLVGRADDGGALALALERMRGATLHAVVERLAGPLSAPLALEVVAQAARGLAAAHAALGDDGAPFEIVHRDVSPDNLFVTEAGAVKLFDFNVAQARGVVSGTAGGEGGGAMLGKLAYMAPEQARGEPVDARADVFSLGAILWELVAGRRLFWRGNRLATLRALMDDPIPPIEPTLDALLARALDRDRAARPSATTLAAALRALAPESPARRAALGALARERADGA